MSWKECVVEQQRERFVLRALAPGANIAALCREFGISRKTGYKWLKRYRERGLYGLQDRSRRPLHHPAEIRSEVVIEIVRLRIEHRFWGARKIRAILKDRMSPEELPSERTIGRILERAGLSRPGRRRRRASGGRLSCSAAAQAPNDVWTIDFKGWWRTRDGKRCEPLTIRDEYSKYVLALKALPSTAGDGVRKAMEQVFAEYGLPKVIRSDNGAPFASTRALLGLTKLSVWWLSLGIGLDRIRPGNPQENGSHERLHLDIYRELESEPAANLRAEQERFDDWRSRFNVIRPHEALGDKTPASVYRRSDRVYPGPNVHISYPDEYETRTVKRSGEISYHGKRRFLSEALAGQTVGIETVDDAMIRIWFGDCCLGQTDPNLETPLRPPASAASQAMAEEQK